MKTDDDIRQAMKRINWNFDDYSSSKYPLDINSIPWYPATFPAPIPKYLVALLSGAEDVVFDPFCGKGTTAVEALKQRRRFIYNDLNPHAVTIMECLLQTIGQPVGDDKMESILKADRKLFHHEPVIYEGYQGKEDTYILAKMPANLKFQLSERGLKEDIIYWFHGETLQELIRLYDHIESFNGFDKGIRKLAFLSILKEVSSQRRHFSYVTDNCRPDHMKYYDAINAYIERLDRIRRACIDFYRQYRVINKNDDLLALSEKCVVHSGNAKDCSYIQDGSVDLIITSPPYLCAQDYILTMRLNDFFYPEKGFKELPFTEIGPRRLRSRPGIVDSYFEDMDVVFKEMYRVLKSDSFFCLIIGQGRGKVSENINVIDNVVQQGMDSGFSQVYRTTRDISFRTNRIGGVDKEDLIVFRKRQGNGQERNEQ